MVLAVSGIKLHNSIIKNKKKENIKLEIIKHTVVFFIVLLILICGSLIEVYLSKNALLLFIKYI